jgi:hypothetical protein
VEGEAEALSRKAVELALKGDVAALRLCLDRIVPARKDRPVCFALPNLKESKDAVKASAAIVEAVAAGDLTPSEAAEFTPDTTAIRSMAVSYRRILQRP